MEKEDEKCQTQIQITEEKDGVSVLPDSLLVDILCRLDSTEEVIRTRKLSKRWRYVWTLVPNLTFDYDDRTRGHLPVSSFFSKVDGTLSRRGQSKIITFKLHSTRYEPRFQSLVNKFIRYVIDCNVEYLDINLWPSCSQSFTFDHFFWENSCIAQLELSSCLLNPTSAISWTKLKNLRLSYMKLDDELIQNILSGCPVLETLELTLCRGYTRIDISSKSVKNLVIVGYCRLDLLDTLEINAPDILYLKIYSECNLSNLSLLDVSSLLNVYLDYYLRDYNPELGEAMLQGIVLSLRHVPEVVIGNLCFLVLSRLEAKGFIRPSNLKVSDVAPSVTSEESSNCDSEELSD